MTLLLIILFALRRWRKSVLTMALIISISAAYAITISGTAPDYAGKKLEFLTRTDPVSGNVLPLFKLEPDGKGNFSAEVDIKAPVYCFCDMGVYRGELILTPEKNLRLTFPKLRNKSFEESKNPYFEPLEVWLQVNGGDKSILNNQIANFDQLFYQLNDQYITQLVYRRQKNYLDTIQKRVDMECSGYSHPVFLAHRELRFKTIEAEMTRAGREKIISTLKKSSADQWKMPAFAGLLNGLFVNTLSNESKTMTGAKIKEWIRNKNSIELKKWAMGFTSTTSPLTELLLLKMFHDAYYSGEFSKTAILGMLRSDAFLLHNDSKISSITREIISKLTFLEKGSQAPDICLPTLAGPAWCTASQTKPYLYLLFADLDVPICQEQVKYLKTMVDKTGQNLQIVVVVSPAVKTDISKFVADNQIPEIILLDKPENSFAGQYKVRAYPSAFLLDKNHRVVMAPAKTPLDGFEFQFNQFR